MDHDRFWSYVDRRGPDECWEWKGARIPAGYGSFGVDGNQQKGAHRLAYEALVGPIPPGLVLDHFVCDNPPCCNPNHLRAVTHRANILRGESPSAKNARKTHCARGHEFTEANTWYRVGDNGQVWRRCRACQRDEMRERYRRGLVPKKVYVPRERLPCPCGKPATNRGGKPRCDDCRLRPLQTKRRRAA